jgi:hypothetical protein
VQDVSENPLNALTDELRWSRLQLRRFELNIVTVFDTFRSRGIEPILIKGWAAAQNYPPDIPRRFSDVDLAVVADVYDDAFQLARSNELNAINIDLHREFRNRDSLPWSELFSRSRLIPIDETEVRVLAPEDHLRVMSTHWLEDGGQYRERLWDIYYAVANRPADFDWGICLDSVSETRRNWVITTIALAKKYLGLRTGDLPFANELEHVPLWIDKCLKREWDSNVRLRPLHTCLKDRKALIQQIRKRIPPNPIQATIDSEARFDDSLRISKQIKSVLVRAMPSIRRLTGGLAEILWKRK